MMVMVVSFCSLKSTLLPPALEGLRFREKLSLDSIMVSLTMITVAQPVRLVAVQRIIRMYKVNTSEYLTLVLNLCSHTVSYLEEYTVQIHAVNLANHLL